MTTDSEDPGKCDFCRLPCPVDTVETTHEGTTYTFCSAACRDAMRESERVFTEYRGYRRFRPGVAALDEHLPQGMLRNSFVLVSGQTGTRDAAVHAELVWRALERGEPAVVVAFQEPPVSVVETFLTMDWNVIPYVERGQLTIVDSFTYRVEDRERMYERMNDWNSYLRSVVERSTVTVRDAGDVRELSNKLDSCLEAKGMVDQGIVVIDSLTELGTLVQPVQAYDFVKDLRADVCKGRFVPVFAGATFTGDGDTFPHDLGYTADGVVDLELNSEIVPDTLIKRARVRKMSGVLSISEYTAYEYTSGIGMVTFDPEAEMEKSAAEGDDADADGSAEGDADAADGDGADDADDGSDADAGPDAAVAATPDAIGGGSAADGDGSEADDGGDADAADDGGGDDSDAVDDDGGSDTGGAGDADGETTD